MDLFHASLRESTRKSYKTGQRAYDRFILSLKQGDLFPFHSTVLSDTELNLAFYIAWLLLRPTITSASTILGYETHVKSLFLEEGCDESIFKTQFLRKVRRGVRNTLPMKADKRGALLLPLLAEHNAFVREGDDTSCILRFGTIMGFMAMLRPHTFEQLKPSSFTIVTDSGQCIKMPQGKHAFTNRIQELRRQHKILGFYIEFQSKTMLNAKAFLPSICSLQERSRLVSICPVRSLINIANRGLVSGYFLRILTKKKSLAIFLQYITGASTTVAPYALRIGGRT